ncbi:Amphiphysin [Galemys pyrenaicus]|uniref:Amphiphysin n=1 Tax=Galemys pyrenaicus TaxID=202257 RepID=A0A8J6ACF3_GALPY|nr:Amphiphysin [Galemys pyrenaicus]
MPHLLPGWTVTGHHGGGASGGGRITPGNEADVAAGILVSAAEGAPVEEAELEKAALPAREGASAEEAKVDTETTEAVHSDRPQPEDTEAVVPQEKVIPSVVIEPASNNEGEGEHEVTIGVESKEVTDDTAFPSETPELVSEQKVFEAPQAGALHAVCKQDFSGDASWLSLQGLYGRPIRQQQTQRWPDTRQAGVLGGWEAGRPPSPQRISPSRLLLLLSLLLLLLLHRSILTVLSVGARSSHSSGVLMTPPIYARVQHSSTPGNQRRPCSSALEQGSSSLAAPLLGCQQVALCPHPPPSEASCLRSAPAGNHFLCTDPALGTGVTRSCWAKFGRVGSRGMATIKTKAMEQHSMGHSREQEEQGAVLPNPRTKGPHGCLAAQEANRQGQEPEKMSGRN